MDNESKQAPLQSVDGNGSMSGHSSHRHAWTVILLAWLIAVVITYWPVISGRFSLTPTNMIYTFLPWRTSHVATEGPLLSDPNDARIPYLYPTYYGDGYSAWNGGVGLGIHVGIEVLINPFNWFYRLPIRYAILLKSFFKFSAAYFGMCWFLRRMKLRWTAVALGAVSYAFSSAMVMWHFWPHTDVMALAPTALGLCHALIHERRIRDTLLLGIVIYVLVVAEMPSYGAYILYLMGFYILFSGFCKYRKEIGKLFCVYAEFGVAAALGIAASLPYLQSLFSAVFDNGYANSSTRLNSARAILPFSTLRLFLLPYYNKGLSGHLNEITGYLGVIACALLLFSLFGLKRKKSWFWLGSLVVLFVLVFTHWMDFIFVKLPGVNTSLKTRLIGLLVLVGTIVAAINLSDLIDHYAQYRSKPLFWLLVAAAFAGVVVLCVINREAKWRALWTTVDVTVFVIAVLGIVFARRETARQGLCILLIVTASVNMGFFTLRYMPRISRSASVIPEPTDTIQYLKDNSGSQRIYPMGEWVLFAETNVYYGLNCLHSHNFANTNDDTRAFLKAADSACYITPTFVRGVNIENTNILKYAGVKYVITKNDSDASTGDSTLVYTGNDKLTTYEISDPAPRFYLSGALETVGSPEEALEEMKRFYERNRVVVFDGEVESATSKALTEDDSVEVTADMGDRIKLDVNATSDRVLVFNDYHHTDWTALIDGIPAQTITANYLFNGVELKAGRHTVEFVFDVAVPKKLCKLTALIIGLMVAGIVATVLFDKRRKQGLNVSENKN